MNNRRIIEKLNENYNEFTGFIAAMEEPDFCSAKMINGVARAQQAETYSQINKPVRFAFSLPKPVLRIFVRKSNRSFLKQC